MAATSLGESPGDFVIVRATQVPRGRATTVPAIQLNPTISLGFQE